MKKPKKIKYEQKFRTVCSEDGQCRDVLSSPISIREVVTAHNNLVDVVNELALIAKLKFDD